MKRTRRNFIKQSTLAGSAMIFPFQGIKSDFLSENGIANDDVQVHLFSKHLQFLDYNGMSEATAEMGFDGLDLTVRPEGHVLPERVTEDLPKAVEAMRKFGLRPQMMTTNVTDANDQASRTVLETASQQGLKYYRMGWLTYPEDRSIVESQSIYAQQFKDLEILNKTQGLIGCYQNHAGNHVGAPIWDLLPILRATKNEHMGAQYDIRHAVVEGGSSWELGLRQIQSYIKSIVIKDFKWGVVNGKWEPINTPLGKGMVDFNRYFLLLKKYKINVPVSLHLEYDLGGAEQGASKITMDKNAIFGQMKKDLIFLKEAWQKAQ